MPSHTPAERQRRRAGLPAAAKARIPAAAGRTPVRASAARSGPRIAAPTTPRRRRVR